MGRLSRSGAQSGFKIRVSLSALIVPFLQRKLGLDAPPRDISSRFLLHLRPKLPLVLPRPLFFIPSKASIGNQYPPPKKAKSYLIPPKTQKGWKIWTVGDDIAWIKFGQDGRLYAINPESGFFGVVPGTSTQTNSNAMATIQNNTIYTNVGVSEDGVAWWEGKDGAPPKHLTDWQGKSWTPDSPNPAAHPNSRFTTSIRQCPSISPEFDNPQGVPLSAIVFGGRRAKVPPLVHQSFDWNHGVWMGATMGSETTAAAAGQVGVLRHDPMAMRPFCGYNMADYWGHWLTMRCKSDKVPKIFHLNCFREDDQGNYLWPGFGENLRILKWIIQRVKGEGKAIQTPIGYVPTPDGLDLSGLDLTTEVMNQLLKVDRDAWREEVGSQEEFFAQFGDQSNSL